MCKNVDKKLYHFKFKVYAVINLEQACLKFLGCKYLGRAKKDEMKRTKARLIVWTGLSEIQRSVYKSIVTVNTWAYYNCNPVLGSVLSCT